MPVGKVSITEYESPSRPYRHSTKEFINPEWEVIETAIRRLDRWSFPFIWFYLDRDAEECDLPDFEICGGNNAFVVCVRQDGKDLFLYDPEGDNEEIVFWESDQGSHAPSSMVSKSIDEVIRVTRHFYDHGSADPQSVWGPSKHGR